MIKLPETPAEVADFIGSNFLARMPATMRKADNSQTPSPDDKYILTAHDLLSAFAELERESEDEAPASDLETVARALCQYDSACGEMPVDE